MAKNKSSGYKHPGGVIGFPRIVLRSEAYRDLSTNARALMLELQDVWRPMEPKTHYSTRRASKALGIAHGSAAKAFKELAEHFFIKCVGESDWFNGKAREWSLTWLSYNGREPSNDWQSWKK